MGVFSHIQMAGIGGVSGRDVHLERPAARQEAEGTQAGAPGCGSEGLVGPVYRWDPFFSRSDAVLRAVRAGNRQLQGHCDREEAQWREEQRDQAQESVRDFEREARGDTAPGTTAANAAAADAAMAAARRPSRKLSRRQIEKMLPELDDSLKMLTSAQVFTAALRSLLQRKKLHGTCDAEVGRIRGYALVCRALVEVLWPQLLRAVLLYLGHVLCGVAMPLVCFALLRWMEEDEPPLPVGLGLVAALALSSALSAVLKEYFSDRCHTLGIWCMSAMCGSSFLAILSLPVTDAYAGTSGKVSELVSHSADTLVGFWEAVLGLLLQPFEMVALVATLYVFVGPAALGGLCVVFSAMGISFWAGGHMQRLSQERAFLAETHSQHLSQVMQAFKALKVNGWEPQFVSRLRLAKEEEMVCWSRIGRWLAVVNVASNPSVDVISLAVVAVYTAGLSQTLTPAVLAAYWVLLALLHGKIFEFPHNVQACAEGLAALARFQCLLLAPSSPLLCQDHFPRQGGGGGELRAQEAREVQEKIQCKKEHGGKKEREGEGRGNGDGEGEGGGGRELGGGSV